MRTTFVFPEILEFPITNSCITRQINNWINSNSYLMQRGLIWEMGITDCNNLGNLQKQIREDFNCKHYKCWKMDSFKEAMEVVRSLNKLPMVFKSSLNNYSNKGVCIFIYKTSIPKNSQLFYSLHS
jgi:hypothetical protein